MVFICRESEGTADKDHEREGTTQGGFDTERVAHSNRADWVG